MRYLIQFAIPALIVLLTVAVLTRRRDTTRRNSSTDGNPGSDTGMFILILLIGATVATAAFIAIGGYLA
jgi:hypothetical protein